MTIFYFVLGAGCFSFVLMGLLAVWLVSKFLLKPRAHASAKPTAATPFASESNGGRGTGSTDTLAEVDKDAWEGSFWEVEEPLPAKARLRLKYIDGSGRKTDRTVQVRQFGNHLGTTLLIGRCLLRNATRTFRTDRIVDCIDEETGEVVSDIRAYLWKRYKEAPERETDDLLEDERDALVVLLYVGKADGRLRAPEKVIIRDTCVAITENSRLTLELISALLTSMDVPSLQAFKVAVGRLAAREQSVRSVLMDAAQRIVATEKTIQPAEQEALDYMRKELFPLPSR